MNHTDMSVHVYDSAEGWADSSGSTVWATVRTGNDQVTLFPRENRQAIEGLADALLDAAKDLLAIAEGLGS